MKLTKFEKTRILSARALQINDGATAYVKDTKENTLDLAKEEFKENKTPLKIIRK